MQHDTASKRLYKRNRPNWPDYIDPEGCNPAGKCHCGCGDNAPLATSTDMARRHIKGQPLNYVAGHHRRIRTDDITENTSGLCQCGCGQKTSIAKTTSTRNGWIRGKPKPYLKGHSGYIGDRTRRDDWVPLNHDGFCLCGCGERTPLATYTMRTVGLQKGVPMRYIEGHQMRNRKTLSTYKVTDTGYETPCWLWTGAIDPVGYGRYGAEYVLAHRVSYEERHGSIPGGLDLHHRCRQRNCINPDHLEPLTRSDHAKAHAKLRVSEETIEKIRAELAIDRTRGAARRAAERHGVSNALAYSIKNGKR